MAEVKRFRIEYAPVEDVRMEARMVSEELQEIQDALEALVKGEEPAFRLIVEDREERKRMAGRVKRLAKAKIAVPITVRVTAKGLVAWVESTEEKAQREERGKALMQGRAKAAPSNGRKNR